MHQWFRIDKRVARVICGLIVFIVLFLVYELEVFPDINEHQTLLNSANEGEEEVREKDLEEVKSIFSPQNKEQRKENLLKLTDNGIIREYNSHDGLFSYITIPAKYKKYLQYKVHQNNREYLEIGLFQEWALNNVPLITKECVQNLRINLFSTALETERGPSRVVNNLVSSLRQLGIKTIAVNDAHYDNFDVNLMVDYWGNSLYDKLIFGYALSPHLNPTFNATFTGGTTFFLKNDGNYDATDDLIYQLHYNGESKRYILIGEDHVSTKKGSHYLSNFSGNKTTASMNWESLNVCDDSFLFLSYCLVEGKYMKERGIDLQHQFLDLLNNQLDAHTLLSPSSLSLSFQTYWKAVSNYVLSVSKHNINDNNNEDDSNNKEDKEEEEEEEEEEIEVYRSILESSLIDIMNSNGEKISEISFLSLFSEFAWVPKLNILGNSCGLSSYLSTLPTTQTKMPIITVPVGVDTIRFSPSSRYYSSTRNSHSMIVYIKRFDTSLILTPLLDRCLEFFGDQFKVFIFVYGEYDEEELVNAARISYFGIIFDKSESQGFAIEELLSLDLPLFIYSQNSVPYFSPLCGEIYLNIADVPILQPNNEWNASALPSDYYLRYAFDNFLEKLSKSEYSPRLFITENLSFPVTAANLVQYLCAWNPNSSNCSNVSSFHEYLECPRPQFPVFHDFEH